MMATAAQIKSWSVGQLWNQIRMKLSHNDIRDKFKSAAVAEYHLIREEIQEDDTSQDSKEQLLERLQLVLTPVLYTAKEHDLFNWMREAGIKLREAVQKKTKEVYREVERVKDTADAIETVKDIAIITAGAGAGYLLWKSLNPKKRKKRKR